jgi:DNA polymerase-3 subunit delta
VKVSKQSIGRTVDQPNPQVRFYLFYGADEGQSRGLAERLREALGATKTIVAASALKSDPAALADEASAMSLFGGKRLVWIEPATKDIEEAAMAVLEGPETENSIVAIAGQLPRTSPLLKLAESSPLAVAFASYIPEGEDAQRMVVDVGRRFGLKIGSSIAARVAASCGNDQAIVAQELQKFAIYIDASPNSPKELAHEAIDALGTDTEGDFLKLADLALGGDLAGLNQELERLPAGGSEAIPVVRSLQRRLVMLAPARARVERGESPDAVMTSMGKSVFFKEKPLIARMLSNWNAERLARVAERVGRLERAIIFTDTPEQATLAEELLAIAREARRH